MTTKADEIFDKLSGIVVQVARLAAVFVAVRIDAALLNTVVQLGLPIFVAYLAGHVAVY